MRVLLPAVLALFVPLLAADGVEPTPAQIRAALDAGRYAEAEAEARALAAQRELADGPDSLAVAEALDLVVESLAGTRKADVDAQQTARRAAAIKEKVLGPDDPALGRTLGLLGNLLQTARDYEGSREALVRSLAILDAAPDSESLDLARTLNSLATLNAGHPRHHADSRQQFQRALGILGRSLPQNDLRIAKTLVNFGHLLREMGEYGEARSALERALGIWESSLGPDHIDLGPVLNNLANLLAEMGDLAGAREAGARSLAIREKKLTPDDPSIATALSNLGNILRHSGDLENARDYFERALELRQRRFGPDSTQVASTLQNYAGLLADVGELVPARQASERTLAIAEKAYGLEHPRVAGALFRLGEVQRRLGNEELARSLYERALEIDARLRPDHPALAATLVALGDMDRVSGDLARARERYQLALGIQTRRLGSDHPTVADTLNKLARLAWERGEPAEALDLARQTSTTVDRYLRATIGVLPERQALSFVASAPHAEEVLVSGLVGAGGPREPWIEACWEWTLRRRGLVLQELAGRHRAAAASESGDARRAWERLAEARRRLAALWIRGLEDDEPELHARALADARKLKEEGEAELARVSARYRAESEALAASVPRIARALPEGAVLVEIVRASASRPGELRGQPRDVALILRPDGATRFADLGWAKYNDALVAAWRGALSESVAATSAAADGTKPLEPLARHGALLRAALWDPIARVIGDARLVFLVPEGAATLVDFAALPASDGRFLVERGPTFHLLGAARDLLSHSEAAPRAESLTQGGALVLGDPDFDAPRQVRVAALRHATNAAAPVYRGAPGACRSALHGPWPRLGESRREAKRIGSLLQASARPVVLLTGPEASEERFKLEAPGRRLLHLATHAFFLDAGCSESGPGSAAPASRVYENPLLLSGLVLAGANRVDGGEGEGEDGILTAEELAALDLSGVDLAVLSACDTGRGEVGVGEGVFGLRRAAEIAGVRSVVMSLWPVPDARLRAWMDAFYSARVAGTPLFEAARRASAGLLEELRADGRPTHPYLWAGLVTAGAWR